MLFARPIAALLGATLVLAAVFGCPEGMLACGSAQTRAHDCCGSGIAAKAPDCCPQAGNQSQTPAAAKADGRAAQAAGVPQFLFAGPESPAISLTGWFRRGGGMEAHAPPDTLLSQRTALLL